jgi:hypothetical protein
MRARLLVVAMLGGLGCGADGGFGALRERGGGGPTVVSRLEQYGVAARARLADDFGAAGVTYPPAEVTLIAVKDEARLEVWARRDGGWAWIADYPVLAASGGAGPKLREGDGQVPEGVYAIDWLNPRSAYHLSLHVDYPNALDRAHAATDGRAALGGAIMIHGSDVSIGCLAMGDPAIEAVHAGRRHRPVARRRPRPARAAHPDADRSVDHGPPLRRRARLDPHPTAPEAALALRRW